MIPNVCAPICAVTVIVHVIVVALVHVPGVTDVGPLLAYAVVNCGVLAASKFPT